jgi:amino acid adenylation domain-containing protein/non-ribosomal peptide synthase protein (TIGR01720 family)
MQSLVEVFQTISQSDKQICFIKGEKVEVYVTYRELFKKASGYLRLLQSRGIGPGEELLISLEDNEVFSYVFWACILGGIIPVPLATGGNDEYKRKLFKVWEVLKKPHLLTSSIYMTSLQKTAAELNLSFLMGDITAKTVLAEEINDASGSGTIADPGPNDTAFIQFSSGSTGDPKGVILTHHNLITNINAIIKCSQMTPQDSMLGWMPLTHDMGLIGCHLTPLLANINQYLLPTSVFIRRPTLWPAKASEHKITLLSSPNFGYRYLLSFFKPEMAEGWDLSSVRLIFNGAEPVSSQLCQEFLVKMSGCRLKKNVIYPVYGMAEASLAVTFPPPGEEMRIIRLDRSSLRAGDRIRPEAEGANQGVTFVDVGYPVENCLVRICDHEDRVVGPETVGHIQIKGGNVTAGYYNNEAATRKAITRDGWLNTGDLGFLREGRLTVTGRAKDIIFVNGQNIYPHDIERVAEEVEGIALGEVAACGVLPETGQAEEIAIFVLFKKKIADFTHIAIDLKRHIGRQMGLEVAKVIPIKRIPKTTSGKVQRYKLAEGFNNGEFAQLAEEIENLMEVELKNRGIDSSRHGTGEVLLSIFREITGIEAIGVNDNFFEYGVNSLVLSQLQNQIDKMYPGKVKITDYFTYPKISGLALLIDQAETENEVALPGEASGDDIVRTIMEGISSRKIDELLAAQLLTMLKQQEQKESNEIAIIGLSCRLPLADNAGKFWENIQNGIDCTDKFPEPRRKDLHPFIRAFNPSLDEADYYDGAYLKEIDQFDYKYFGLTPKQANLTDPNHRLFLETISHAIEDAGYGGGKLQGSNTGVYAGFALHPMDNYGKMVYFAEPESLQVSTTGNLPAIVPSRISYLLDLKGPSMVIDTACSSSLVAVHLACQGLMKGDCEIAIAAGVKIQLFPVADLQRKIGIESSNGRTRTFDDSSDGTGLGEGVVAILLKPLNKAVKDRDHIYAVIKGSAINQDGTSAGITAPNSDSQARVILKAWQNAGVDPETIAYLEAHGTGTKIGDPIEIEGIQKAFQAHTGKKQFCAIGTVKTNIGHLFECSGLAGLVKAVLALKNKQIPPVVHFQRPNHLINFVESPVYVNDKLQEWEAGEFPRRCGVSAFGFSGTNCHVVLEEAPQINEVKSGNDPGVNIFTLSAKSPEALGELAKGHLEWLRNNFYKNVADICYTINTGRGHFPHRLAFIVKDKQDLMEKLEQGIFNCGLPNSDCGLPSVDSGVQGIGSGIQVTDLNERARCLLKEFISGEGNCRPGLADEICRLYVMGADIEWEELYRGRDVRKVSLPGYPFQRVRCWLDVEETTDEDLGLDNQYVYGLNWRQENLEKGSGRVDDSRKGAVVILKNTDGDHGVQGSLIAQRLRSAGRAVIEVEWGLEYQKLNDGAYVVGGTEEDFQQLFRDLKVKGITRILHLFSCNGDSRGNDLEFPEDGLNRGLYSLFHLTKVLVSLFPDHDLEICLLSEYVYKVTGREEVIKPENASMFGLGKIVEREYPQLKCKCIDIDWSAGIEAIMLELGAGEDKYDVAYREGKRYVPEFGEIELKQINGRNIAIQNRGVYLITGGMGGIGLEVARFLAAKDRVILALINRSRTPDRKSWGEILAKNEDPKLCNKIRAIQAIESTGSEVFIYSADISKMKEVTSIVAELRSKFGKINGVIHCAGMAGDNVIVKKDLESFKEVISPKVQGTWVLDKVTENEALDFFVVFSSVATIFGAPGQGDYTAANCYLDSYAQYQSMQGKRWLAIDWVAWKETGMAVECGANIDTIFKAIPTERALSVFDAVLHREIDRVLIGEINYRDKMFVLIEKFPVKLSLRITGLLKQSSARLSKNLQNVKKEKRTGQIGLTGRSESNYSETEKLVAGIWGSNLGYKEINIYDNFYDLGADSILAMKIVNEINLHTGLNLSIVEILNRMTVDKLAGYIDEINDKKKPNQVSGGRLIQPAKLKEFYPMSSAQRRMYILYQLGANETNYNITLVQMIEGKLDVPRMERVIKRLIERHEALRTSFEVIDGGFGQRIHREAAFELEYQELQARDNQTEADVKVMVEEFIRPFDLGKAPLLRGGLIKLSEERYVFMFDLHHIITDGVSMGILTREFAGLYHGEELPGLRIQYKDFSEWQNEFLKSNLIRTEEEYWLGRFAGEIPVLDLPTDYPRPSVQSFEGSNLDFELGEETTARLNRAASGAEATLYMTLLAAYNVLLYKYTGQNVLVVGSPIAGRHQADLETVLGIFVNTLAMRNRLEGGQTFGEFLKAVRENALQAYENQDYQFEELVEKLDLRRDLGRNPLFDVMVVLQNIDTGRVTEIHDLKLAPYEYETRTAKFDLTLTATEMDGKIGFSLEYCTKLFRRETVERLAGHFLNILKQAAQNFAIGIAQIELATEEEKRRILYEFNATQAEYPKDKTIHQLFEEQVEKTPENVAVVLGDRRLTYRELNGKANQLVGILREKGVKPDSIVGIMVERSPEMIIAIMGVLKAGGAYLPIDPGHPGERVRYILENSGTRVLLIDNGQWTIDNGQWTIGNENPLLVMNLKDEGIYRGEGRGLENINKPSDLAYVIYTSGSTGRPKGVMVEHHSVVNIILALQEKYPIHPQGAFLLKTTFTFDVSVAELFGWFVGNGSLVILPEGDEKDPQGILKAIKAHPITHINFVPSMFSVFINKLTAEDISIINKLKYIFVAGEALKREVVERFQALGSSALLENLYGPTEATVYATGYSLRELKDETRVPIGKPLKNVNVFITNQSNQLQPIGVPGELCIAGDGVGRGYLGRAELTGERFVVSGAGWGVGGGETGIQDSGLRGTGSGVESAAPSCPLADSPVHRFTDSALPLMYKTGDLARWLADGNIEYLGRMDHQVKIRGFRIELGEIESHLLRKESIKEAVVVTKEDSSGNKYLCGYFVSDRDLPVAELKGYLAKELPDYMIPSYFVRLERMPLTSSGKIDRKALPEPGGKINTGVEYEAPGNEMEEKLAGIWQEVLGVERAGINDNFFMLGGDSIKAIQAAARLQKERLAVEIRELFRYPTIKELSRYVKPLDRKIDQGVVAGEVELTPIQAWFFERDFAGMNHWNQSVALFNKDGFEVEAVRNAFSSIVKHHDALRMGYEVHGETVKQFNRGIEGELFTLKVSDLVSEENYRDKIEAEAKELQGSIDLHRGPLVKIGLFKTRAGDHLLMVIHHLVIDGISWRILLEDFASAYRQAINGSEITLQEKTDSYQQWAKELQAYANSKEFRKEQAYWRELEESEVKPLPGDYSIEDDRVKQCRNLQMELSAEETEKLLRLTNCAYHTEVNDILLTALGLAVREWTGEEKILITLEGHGREGIIRGINITRTVGWFTTMYPVVLRMPGDQDISVQVQSVKEGLRRIPNKGIGYGILKYLTPPENKQSMRFKLKPEIIFNYLGQFDQDVKSDVFQISSLGTEAPVSENSNRLYVLDINAVIIGGRLSVTFNYNRNQYREETVRKLGDGYLKNLRMVMEYCLQAPATEEPVKWSEDPASIKPVEEREYYPVSAAQKRMYLLNRLNGSETSYNIPGAIMIEGELDRKRMEDVLRVLLKRHESFRTSFEMMEGEPVQKICEAASPEIKYLESTADKVDEIIREFIQPFDLSKAPLLRVGLIELSQDRHIMMFDLHHIITDGTSMGILTREFISLYNREELPELRVQYKDFSQWQNELLQSETLRKQEEFWLKTFAGELPVLNMPTDYPRPRVINFEGDSYDFELGEELTGKLRQLMHQTGSTLFMLFLASYNLLLSRLTGQEEIIIGTTIAGRRHADIQNIIGVFLNTLALRNYPRSDQSFGEFLEEVKENSLGAFENQDYQFETLLEKLRIKRDPGRNPLFDMVINYQVTGNEKVYDTKNEALKFTRYDFRNKTTTFDLILFPFETAGNVEIRCGYRTSLFKRSTIEYLMGEYLKLLEAIAGDPNKRLRDYDIFNRRTLQAGRNRVKPGVRPREINEGEA